MQAGDLGRQAFVPLVLVPGLLGGGHCRLGFGRVLGNGMAAVDAAWPAYADTGDDPVEQHLAHLALHRALWQASGNSVLMRMWPVAESMSTLVLAQDQAVRRDPHRARAVHARLVEAIRSRDPVELDIALADHTQRSAEEFLTLRGE